MSDELSTSEKIVEEVLIDLMIERVMYEREMSTSIQASSMRGLQVGSSQPLVKERTKHKDDIANAKLIPSILSNYIPPLAGAMS
jgi:hypothetical protein